MWLPTYACCLKELSHKTSQTVPYEEEHDNINYFLQMFYSSSWVAIYVWFNMNNSPCSRSTWNFTIGWTLGSPDLTPLTYSWRYTKATVYYQPLHMISMILNTMSQPSNLLLFLKAWNETEYRINMWHMTKVRLVQHFCFLTKDFYIIQELAFILKKCCSATTLCSLHLLLWCLCWPYFLFHPFAVLYASPCCSCSQHSIPIILEFCHFPSSWNVEIISTVFLLYLNNIVLDIHNFSNFQVPDFFHSWFPCSSGLILH